VGNHMYQMAWLCYLHPSLHGQDQSKAVMMCLTHDIGEITAGDITPADNVDPQETSRGASWTPISFLPT
jgi:5'-deoxynucleotidase YfbR-like HD superfamily hydrolase